MKKLLLLIVVGLMLTGVANAAIRWIAPPPGEANWSIGANWNAGGPIPTSADKTQFVDDAAECIVDTAAESGQTVIGDNGGDEVVHVVTIRDGGSLSTYGSGTWTAAGYNRVGIVNVERGGSLVTEHRLGVGLVGSSVPTVPSYLNVNGGDVSIDGNLQIGEINHIGIVNVNSGTLEATGWEWRDETGTWSFIDVKLGTLIIDGDVTGDIPDLVSSGALTGFGTSSVNYDYNVTNPGGTTITADDPLERTPAMDALVPTGTVSLSWKNVDPVTVPGYPVPTNVWVDVWYGTDTDPCSGFTKVVSQSQDLTTWDVSAPVFDEHVWRIDTYRNGNPAVLDYDNDPNLVVDEGEAMYFVATDDWPPSVVIDSNDIGTWAGEPVIVTATITDDGASLVDYAWSSDNEPNITFSEMTPPSPLNVTGGSATVTVKVTGDSWQSWSVVTITVGDQVWPAADSDSSRVDVARDACHAAGGGSPHLWDVYTADFDQDCIVNLADFAVVYQQWLDDYKLTVPLEVP